VKQGIDIEQLVRWTFREELSKRVTSSAEGVWAQLTDWQLLGAAVDLGTRGPQRYDHGVPHRDALVIEKAVAQLPDAVIDWEAEALSVLDELLALVDPRKENNAPAATPERLRDTTTVGWTARSGRKITLQLGRPRQVILVRSLRTSALVTMHGNAGTRPGGHSEMPRPQPVPSDRGPNHKLVGECKGRNWYSTGSYCPLRWEPCPITIAEARADYLAWWRGLDQLARSLAGQLEKFHPLRPGTSEMPWLWFSPAKTAASCGFT